MLVKEFIIKFWIELQGVYQWPPSTPTRKIVRFGFHATPEYRQIVRFGFHDVPKNTVGVGFHANP